MFTICSLSLDCCLLKMIYSIKVPICYENNKYIRILIFQTKSHRMKKSAENWMHEIIIKAKNCGFEA